MAKRCLIITYYFPPTGGGGVQRILKLIKYISRKDWQSTVLTAGKDQPSIPVDQSLELELPENCKVIRISEGQNKEDSGILSRFKAANFALRWASAFLYIPDIRTRWIKPALEEAIKEVNTQKYDCILVSSPPYSLSILAAELQKKSKIPIVLDMRDPWTTNPYKIHPTIIHKLIDRRIEKKNISRMKWGVSAYNSLIDYYQHSIPDFLKQNWQHIPNGYDEEDFRKLPMIPDKSSEFNLAFSGTFYSHINNPLNLFKAIKVLSERLPQQAIKLRFHHYGKSNINLQKLAKRLGISAHIVVHGYMNHRDCLDELNKMDALCFILDDRHPNSRMTIGGKVYEYLRLKKPILAMVPGDGEAAQLIRQTDSGVVVSSREIEQISEILISWMSKKPGYTFKGIEQFSRENQSKLFLDFFNKIINN